MMKKRQKGTIYNRNITKSSAHTHKPTTNQKPGTKYVQEKILFEEHREND